MKGVSGRVTERTMTSLTQLGNPEKTWVIVGTDRGRPWNMIEV